MNDEPTIVAAVPGQLGRKVLWILAVGLLCLGGVLAARSRLVQFASPGNFDPSPLPRLGRNAPFKKTPDKVALKMIEMAQITAGDRVYDLGCGDGRLVITAAVQTGCRGVGFDIEPERVTEAIENTRLHDVDQLVTIEQQDVFKVDLFEADVVLMYLLPWMVQDLVPQFNLCRPGTRLVSHDFWIEGYEIDRTEQVELADGETKLVHLYYTPLKKSNSSIPQLRLQSRPKKPTRPDAVR